MSIWEKLFSPKKAELLNQQEKPYSLEKIEGLLKNAETKLADLNKQKNAIQQRINEGFMPGVNRENLERIEREIKGQEDKIALLKEKMRHEASK